MNENSSQAHPMRIDKEMELNRNSGMQKQKPWGDMATSV
jgi:hypothetical protein